ncbi:MAG: hypothetical protein ASARMPREDX12_003728 [Alectoria sarmentosa]|nr:MAG: hypothetical protein ASARMPREDX12_003728 [Alectoria sarmentosa]
MARLSSFVVLSLIAASGQAAPAGQVLTTIRAAPFSNGPDGLPNLPTTSGPSGPLTMTELGGNVIACPSQVTFLLSSTTYLDCLEPVSTITVGTSSASALNIITFTNAAGSTLEGLPLVYANRTATATLLPFSTGQVSSASSATQAGGSASSFGLASSSSRSQQPGGNTTPSVLSSSASGPPSGLTSSAFGVPFTSTVTSSGRNSSTLQPGGTGPASLSIVSSASSNPTQGTNAASAPGASYISSANSLSINGPTTQATPSGTTSGRSGSNASGNFPSVTSGPSNSQRLSVSRSNIPPTISPSTGSILPPAPAPLTYSIDGVGFTGNPSSLVAGSTTLTPGGAPLVTSSHTFSIPVSATGNQINVDGTLTILPSPQTGSGSSIAAAPSTYSIDGVGFTGNPSSLAAGSTTLTPGGAPLVTSSHTFSIPVSATGGQINVDGTLTTLPSPQTGSGSSNTASAPARSSISSQSNSTAQSLPGIIVGGITSTLLTTNAQGSKTSEVVVVGPTTLGASLPGPITSAASSNSQTPTVTSTETAIPPGASAETLTSGAFLFNQWITTTKPGSSTPTVIPIILPPGGGPPIALWGFLPGPPPGGDLPNPPALEINIPKLKIPCIKLFGLKFGDCSSDDGSNSDNPTDDPTNDPTNKPTNKPTQTEPSDTQSAPSTTNSQSSPSSQSSSQSRLSSSSGSQSCSGRTATITQVSCATAGTSTSCTTQFNTNVGCSASGSAITSGSCVAKTTVGSSTVCCSSATVSSGSTVCAFADLTQWDMNSPPSDLQTAPPSAQLASEFSAYLATYGGASGGFGNGTAASATGSVSSKSQASSTGPASVSATASAVKPPNSASSAGLTTSGSSSVASPAPTKVTSLSSAAANDDNPLCIANGLADQCVCSTGTIIVTISTYFNPSSNVCGYTSIPSTPVVTPHTSSTPKPTGAIYTYTDPNYGYVVACDSTYTSEVAGYVITECTGSSSTISTAASVVSFDSVYLAGESSSSVVSAASAASVSAAAATPTARILITYFTFENDDVFLYQYRAYDGVPTKEIAYCSTASPISFVNLNNGNGDPSDLPTNQLPKFTTHGIKDCTYSSPSSSEAGTVSCPGWANPVQCTSVVGSAAQEYQCPTFSGGTEQQPIVNCDWGTNP